MSLKPTVHPLAWFMQCSGGCSIGLIVPLGIVGLVVMQNTANKQRLGDLVARTVAVQD